MWAVACEWGGVLQKVEGHLAAQWHLLLHPLVEGVEGELELLHFDMIGPSSIPCFDTPRIWRPSSSSFLSVPLTPSLFCRGWWRRRRWWWWWWWWW